MRLTKHLISKNSKIYDDYYKDGIIDGWDDSDKEYSYKYFFKIQNFSNRDFKNSSVLDVGCGSGDLVPYLRNVKIEKYLGIDIYEPAIKIAKKKYPNENFQNCDLLKKNFHKFDFVICSGALSTNLTTPKNKTTAKTTTKLISPVVSNYDFIKTMLEKMWSLSKYGVTFNCFTNDTEGKASHIFYYNLNKLRKICLGILGNEGFLKILKNPLKNEFGPDEKQITVYLIRKTNTTGFRKL